MQKEVALTFNEEYRSIKDIRDASIPALTVVCGPNGCGKTQLLNAIYEGNITATDSHGSRLSSKIFNSSPELSASEATIQTLQETRSIWISTKELLWELESIFEKNTQPQILHASSGWIALTRETLMEGIIRSWDSRSAVQFHSSKDGDSLNRFLSGTTEGGFQSRWDCFKQIVPKKILSKIQHFSANEIIEIIHDFVQLQTFMNIDVSIIFYRYFEEKQNNVIRQAQGSDFLESEQFEDRFGTPPWDAVNSLLKKYGFIHKFVPPNSNDDPRATNGYKALIINQDNDEVDIQDLSSGEKVILALLLSAYAADQANRGIFHIEIPDLILFDELDAHLHPSMARMMFDVLENGLVQKLSSKIIVTTHSPSTVALAPKNSVYRLSSTDGVHVLQSIDAVSASQELSGGFLQLWNGSHLVIVEGKDDPFFYRAIERALRARGDLANLPPLHFVPASKKSDPSEGGGASNASDWANKLTEANLTNIHALLDRDRGQHNHGGAIKVLAERYAIENYLVDPLSLAVALITDQRLQDVIPEEEAMKFPQVRNLLDATQTEIQSLVDGICKFILANCDSLSEAEATSIEYSLGFNLDIPKWICDTKGKVLAGYVREAFRTIDPRYVITRKDMGEYDLNLGYLLKLWSQHSELFPTDLRNTLMSFSA